MTERLGKGDWTFEVQESWAKIPDEIVLGDCAAVGVDSKDNVYAFNRGDHPVAVFDKAGNLLRTWGEGVFTRPHGVHVAPDDTIWLTDDGDHTVRHCTLEGKILMTLGVPGNVPPPTNELDSLAKTYILPVVTSTSGASSNPGCVNCGSIAFAPEG